MTNDKNRQQEQESRRILKGIAGEAGSAGAPSGRQVAKRPGNISQQDRIESWGTRIGRILGMTITIGLAIWLLRLLVSNG